MGFVGCLPLPRGLAVSLPGKPQWAYLATGERTADDLISDVPSGGLVENSLNNLQDTY